MSFQWSANIVCALADLGKIEIYLGRYLSLVQEASDKHLRYLNFTQGCGAGAGAGAAGADTFWSEPEPEPEP